MTDVACTVDGSIWVVGIDRPDRANALSRRTVRDLVSAVDAAEAAVSATGTDPVGLVVTGGDERFSAGADLSELAGSLDDLGFDDELERLCHRLAHSPLPVVAAVEGACYGAAVDLAWACDAAVVSSEASLAVPSTSLGILYNPVSVARLHARLGSQTVRRLMVLQQELRGSALPAGAAVVVPAGTAVDAAKGLLRAVSADRRATAATKALLASLDIGVGFDPAIWQPEREARLESADRREALEARRASIGKGGTACG